MRFEKHPTLPSQQHLLLRPTQQRSVPTGSGLRSIHRCHVSSVPLREHGIASKTIGLVTLATRLATESGGVATNPLRDKPIEEGGRGGPRQTPISSHSHICCEEHPLRPARQLAVPRVQHPVRGASTAANLIRSFGNGFVWCLR